MMIIEDDWTDEEIEALPMTTTVFDKQPLKMDAHDWQQQGYFIHDVCSARSPDCHHQGLPIPSGKLLVKDGGKYSLVDEVTRI